MKTMLFAKKAGRCAFLLLLLVMSLTATGQYFGRNKVNYQQFDFTVLQSPHFDIYNYLKDTSVRNFFARWCEEWYKMHQAIFEDSFEKPNPLLLYNHHAHFQQTRAISGLIDVSTGGITESFKNRVVMPFMESNAQTDHVLGHELVHAFQYHLIENVDSLSLTTAFDNLPLWMVEGLAEYMSIGYTDPQTAMWLRAAVQKNKLPSLKDLTNKPYEYFPYRWGHAFWAYVSGVWGDGIIRRLFSETALQGYKKAIKEVLGVDEKVFSEKWKESLVKTYQPFLRKTTSVLPGQQLIDKKNGGRYNVVPSISPDGKWVAFWTEKDVFTFDLYIANAATGKMQRKITSNSFSTHIDEYSSYESAIAWSPDSRQIAFVAFIKGENHLIIADATNGKIRQELRISRVDGFSNPAWSPDGKTIVVTGIKDGQSDLYVLDLNTKNVRQLTKDRYADLQPCFSPDGKWIVFASDRPFAESDETQHHRYRHNITLFNIETGKTDKLNLFPGANNLNAVFGKDSNTIYFLSDRDGFRNLYVYDRTKDELIQLTQLSTGITGITLFAPAISVARKTGRILYTYYASDGYSIYAAGIDNFLKYNIIDRNNVDLSAAVLPPLTRSGKDVVEKNIAGQKEKVVIADTSLKVYPYQSKLQLDYLGNGGIGISTGRFGSGLAGGINGIFSDMLGNHQLAGAFVMNGELVDAGGMFGYLNQKKRTNWGVSISHIPYLSGFESLSPDTIVINSDTLPVLNYSIDLLRIFEDQVSLLGIYPFSQTRRFEAGASFARYYYRLDRYSEYYHEGSYVGYQKQKKLPVPKGFNYGQAYVALVGDNSHFGVASPLSGHRYRLEAGKFFGVVNTYSLLGDYRRYFRFSPFTFAVRNLFYGRFGKDADNGVLSPLYLGFPGFVHGYDPIQFTRNGKKPSLNINDLLGSRIYVANAELRYPLTGPERLSGIKSRILFSELSLFTDGGIAWGNAGVPESVKGNDITQRQSKFIMSSGISLRINLFGYLVIEPHYSIPWQNGGWKNFYFGVNFMPGW